MTDIPKYDKANSLGIGQSLKVDKDAIQDRLTRFKQKWAVEGVQDAFGQVVGKSIEALDKGEWSLRPHVVDEILRLDEDLLPRYLYYRYRYDVYPVQHRADTFAPCLQIEPTSLCNYRCVFCFQTDVSFSSSGSGHMGSMDLSLFKKVIDEAEGQCEAINLASRGEPLMCRDIVKMLDYIRGKFLAAKLNTNAFFLDEKKAHAILQADLSTVVFSADAAAEPLYSQLRVNGKLDKVLFNVRRFQEIRRKHYPKSKSITRVSGVRYSNSQSIKDMETVWSEWVDQVAFVDYNPWENVYSQPSNGITTPCSDLWRRMFVWWDGRVNPCDVDYKSTLAVGNGSDQSLSALWRSEMYEKLRRDHLENRRPDRSPCRSCAVV